MNVMSPGQILSDVHIEVFEAAHSVHWGPTDDEWGVNFLSPPEVHNQLLSFSDFQRETMMSISPPHQGRQALCCWR